MNHKEWEEKVRGPGKLAERISNTVKSRITPDTRKEICTLLSTDGITRVSANQYLSTIITGYAYSFLPHPPYYKQKPETKLWRLAVILHYLEIDAQDDVISKIKDLYPQFEYPPRRVPERMPKPPLEEMISKLTAADRTRVTDIVYGIVSRYEKNGRIG